MRALQVVDLAAAVDERAVDDPGDYWRQLARCDGPQILVEQGEAGSDLPQADQRRPAPETSTRLEVGVIKAICDVEHLLEHLPRALDVTLHQRPQCSGHDQVTHLNAIALSVIEEPPAAREPASSLSLVAALHEIHDQVARAADRRQDLSTFEISVVSALKKVRGFLIFAHELGGDSEPVEVLRLLRALQVLVRLRPVVPVVRAPPCLEISRP